MIEFPEDVPCAEDGIVILSFLLKNISICVVKEPLYNYDKTINKDSLTKTLDAKDYLKKYVPALNWVIKVLKDTEFAYFMPIQKALYKRRLIFQKNCSYSLYKSFYPEITKKEILSVCSTKALKLVVALPFYVSKVLLWVHRKIKYRGNL